jgi:transcriptional regulator with XRE-family HTH domain
MLKVKVTIKQAARKRKNWSLYRLAKELKMPQQTVYGWANGRTQPSYINIAKICEMLECKVKHLFKVVEIKEINEPIQPLV